MNAHILYVLYRSETQASMSESYRAIPSLSVRMRIRLAGRLIITFHS